MLCFVTILHGAEPTSGNLLRAVQYDLRTAAWHLLEEGAPTNGISRDGTTLAMWAARNGNLEFLEALLTRSSEHRRNRPDGYTLVMAAAESGDTYLFDFVTRQTGLGAFRSDEGYTLAMAAAKGGSEDIFVRVRNQAQARDLTTRTRQGYTLLMAAAEGGNLKIFNWVLEQMPSREELLSRPATGETLLHFAVRGTNPRITRYVLNNGLAELLDTGDLDRRTALHEAILVFARQEMRGGSSRSAASKVADAEQVLRLLLMQGADPNLQDLQGFSAAHYLAQTPFYQLIPALHAAGADFTLKTSGGKTPLEIAREHSQSRMATEMETLQRILEDQEK